MSAILSPLRGQVIVLLAWTLAVGGAFLCYAETGNSASAEELARFEQRLHRLREQSRWVEAAPLAEQLVALTRERYGEDHTNTATALHLWAFFIQQNGDYDKAEELFLRALAIDEKLFGKDTVQTARRLHMLAGIYRDRGDYQKAMPLLERALAIREKHLGPNHGDTAQVIRTTGQLYALMGDFARAEPYLLRALKIWENDGPYAQYNVPGTLSALGWLYLAIRDYDQAERMMKRSLELRKKQQGLEHEGTAASFGELAIIQRARGKLDEAERLFHQGLAIREKLYGTNHVSLFETLNYLATMHLDRGELDKAEPLLSRSRSLVEKNLGAEHPKMASVLMRLSWLHEMRGDGEVAKMFCERARCLQETHFGVGHHGILDSLKQLACLEAALGHPERAVALANRLQQTEEDHIANVLSFTSERQRLTYQRDSSVASHRYDLWGTLGATEPLARAVFRTKGLVLDSLIEDRQLAEASSNPQVRDLVDQLGQSRRRLARFGHLVAQETPSAARNPEMEGLSAQIEMLETSLTRRVAGLGRARRALSVEVEQVLAAIPEETVLLEMLRYRHYEGKARWQETYGVLILSQRERPHWIRLGPAEAIDNSIKLYQHAVRNPEAGESFVQCLRDLYEKLWAPLAGRLPVRTTRVIVSPDAQLNFVSFVTLLNSANRLLGEDYLFSYVSTGRDLLAERETIPAAPQLLIWANPDFGALVKAEAGNARVLNRELRGLNFLSLPGAEKEGRALWKRAWQFGFRDAVLRVGARATEAELHRLHSPMALHVATHGFLLPPAETGHAIEEEYSDSMIGNRTGPFFNPMLRSGFALAGAQRTLQAWAEGKIVPSHDDGIVTAAEIGSLNLRGTSLVVLSTCDSGTGEARAGEGVLGLRRGFIQAGAQNLLLTLWPIDDGTTSGLMFDFYAGLHRGAPQALVEAQRKWLQKLRAEKGIGESCRIAGPFILSFQGRLN